MPLLSAGVRRVSAAAALAAGLGCATVTRLAPANRDPDAARLVTSDIPLFWRVFDRATPENAAELFQHEYLEAGSPGLRDFTPGRIVDGRGLAAAVLARRRFYAAIRAGTLALDTARAVKDSVRAGFRRLKALYRDAAFPDVYFLIGRLSSGGTTSSRGLLIGVEINARDDSTPVDELNDWERAVTGRIADLPHIVAHELVHFQQGQGRSLTLLAAALREGGADFVAELVSGAHTNRIQRVYGDAHERELWEEFSGAMTGTDLSRWFFQGDRAGDRPADLGYYVGYRICESFYRRAADQAEALRRIIRVADAEALLRESGYAELVAGGSER